MTAFLMRAAQVWPLVMLMVLGWTVALFGLLSWNWAALLLGALGGVLGSIGIWDVLCGRISLDGAPLAAQSQAPLGAVEPVWRCFHCDEAFTDQAQAALHFGTRIRQEPGCQVDLQKFREMESLLERHCDEDTDLHRELHALQTRMTLAVQRAEEVGYARGLDALQQHETEKIR